MVAILPCLDWHWLHPCHVWDGLLAMPAPLKPGVRVAMVIVYHFQSPPCTSKGPISTAIDRNFKISKPPLRHQTGLTRTRQGADILLGNGTNPAVFVTLSLLSLVSITFLLKSLGIHTPRNPHYQVLAIPVYLSPQVSHLTKYLADHDFCSNTLHTATTVELLLSSS
jgi:hypothetical protein